MLQLWYLSESASWPLGPLTGGPGPAAEGEGARFVFPLGDSGSSLRDELEVGRDQWEGSHGEALGLVTEVGGSPSA